MPITNEFFLITYLGPQISDVTPTLAALVADKLSWADVAQKYPKFTQQEASK